MSTSIQLIASSPYGCIFTCGVCDALHLEFGMICARFESEGFMRFHDFITRLEIESLLEREPIGGRPPHIRIALPPTNLALALNLTEIEALRHLLHDGSLYLQEQYEPTEEMTDLFEGIEAWLNRPDT
jgi:hypothetical protein